MVAFKQQIRRGNVGLDAAAVKRCLHRRGFGRGIVFGPRFGSAAALALERFQHAHSLKPDGVYGPATHARLAPGFSAFEAWLYRRARLRVPAGSAQDEARALLRQRQLGRYRADNPGDLRDLEATAAGKPVWSQGGYWVHLDPRPLRALLWLIETHGYRVGTFALCSDHFNDGPHGHAGGRCVDVSSIDNVSVGSGSSCEKTLAVARLMHSAPDSLRPRQLICGGCGYRRSSAISACSIPGADSYYGSRTMAEHTNHLHIGY